MFSEIKQKEADDWVAPNHNPPSNDANSGRRELPTSAGDRSANPKKYRPGTADTIASIAGSIASVASALSCATMLCGSKKTPATEALPFDDEDVNYVITHEDTDDDDISLIVDECELETAIDREGDDTHKSPILQNVTTNFESLDDTLEGRFASTYRRLRDSNDNDIALTGLTKDIADLIRVANDNVDDLNRTLEELEAFFNCSREKFGELMAKALIDNGHEDLVPYINLGTKFSCAVAIVFFLHYAPAGSEVMDDDKFNYCRLDQCCIALMTTGLLSFLVNESRYGSKQMEEWSFGGRTDIDESSKMACVDLFPFLLEKKDSKADMERQYKDIATKFGVKSYYELMIVPFCLLKMHMR